MIVFGAPRPTGRGVAEVDHSKIERIRTEEPIMTSTLDKIQTAIKNYDQTGPGGEISKEDREEVHNFVIAMLASGQDITVQEAIKMVHLLEAASWSDGWNRGYSSAKDYYGPKRSA